MSGDEARRLVTISSAPVILWSHLSESRPTKTPSCTRLTVLVAGGNKNPVTAIPSSPSVGQQRSPCTCFAPINQKLRCKNKPKHSQQVLRRLEKLRFELAESGIPDILTLFINWELFFSNLQTNNNCKIIFSYNGVCSNAVCIPVLQWACSITMVFRLGPVLQSI